MNFKAHLVPTEEINLDAELNRKNDSLVNNLNIANDILMILGGTDQTIILEFDKEWTIIQFYLRDWQTSDELY